RSCPRVSSSSSGLLLVSVQVSVSSAWRLTHSAKTEKKPISEASTISTIETILRDPMLLTRPPRCATGRGGRLSVARDIRCDCGGESREQRRAPRRRRERDGNSPFPPALLLIPRESVARIPLMCL